MTVAHEFHLLAYPGQWLVVSGSLFVVCVCRIWLSVFQLRVVQVRTFG